METVKHGRYGFYYPYTDEDGKSHGIKILDDVYENYYKPGYLKDEHIEEMLKGKTIYFNIPKKSGSGEIHITAKIIPYTTKEGKDCNIIKFESDKIDDKSIINANAEKIVCSYWTDTRFDYTKPQGIIDTLDLEGAWKTWSQNYNYNDKKYGVVEVYKYRARSDNRITFYCEVNESNECSMITEEQYNSAKATHEKLKEEAYLKQQKEYENASIVKKDLCKWVDNIYNQIWTNDGLSDKQILDNAESILSTVDAINLNDRLTGLLTSYKSYSMRLSDYFDKVKSSINYEINTSNYTNTAIIENIKTNFLNNIKVHIEYCKLNNIKVKIQSCKDLSKQYESEGLESMTDSINIDTALSLGYFPTVQKVLVKYKTDAPKYIIHYMYLEDTNASELKEKLLNLLKIYYDFYDMPEKDRKSIAKYIAKNKLSDYYERISKFDDVLETLVDESKDAKLLKPLLESIAGTSKTTCLKDKTYYFEKRGRLKSNILVYKPIELVDKLRTYIKEFNVSSNVAILVNIELDSDESFIFQFYTFAGGENASDEFDGRRMLNLTRIYNRHCSEDNKKIGFIFDNGSSTEEDD